VADEQLITITGIEEACAMLTAAPDNVVKIAYGKALAAAAVPIVEALEAATPQDTGKLKESIVSDIALDADGKGGVLSVGFSGNQGHIANFVEYGHRMIGHKPEKKDLGQVQPHPFMRPAASVSADAAIEAFAESVEETVRTHYGS
jgi:HK97 gp10 family phage protein